MDGELRPATNPALNVNARVMQFDDPPHYRESKPCISGLASIATPETAKDKVPFLLRDARTSIQHPHRAALLYNKFHHRSRRGVFDGVLCKISDRALHHLRIAFNPYRLACAEERDFPTLLERQGGDGLGPFRGDT